MKEIKINKIDEVVYYSKLDNGLDVYLYTNPNIHNNYVTFTTKYGSIYNKFYVDGKLETMPNGIAHFLEHKVFALENDPQPEEFFGKSGGLCNAYTTFKNTTYLFNSTCNVIENTMFLLDFVQNLYLTDENVESEKGIINQEINMCDDTPSDILYDKIRLNTIKSNPFRESIIGTSKEVNSITIDMLKKCYNTFYNPSNMFLVVTGNFDKDEMFKAICDNQKNKVFNSGNRIKLDKYKETNEIVKAYEEVKCNTNVPKMAFNIKIPFDKFNMDIRRLSIYMFLIFNLLFGDTSSFDKRMKDNGMITNSLYYNLLDIDTHFVVSLINNTSKYKELIKEIEKALKDISINEKDFIRKKKVLISNEVFSYENVESINDMIVDNIIFDNRICTDMISIIDSLSYEEMMDIIKKVDFNNKSVVILKK